MCWNGCAARPERRAARSPDARRSGGSSDLIADGLTNRQIAEEMFLAEKTVKNYVSNLLAKLGMSAHEAAVYAARLADSAPPGI